MTKELFNSDNALITNNDWIKAINKLKPESELFESEEKIALKVKTLLTDAIKERLEGIHEVGIFFSGGLDSSIIASICKKENANFTCYTVGFQDGNMEIPEDIKHARNVAKFLKLNENEFKEKIFTLKEAENILKKTANILKNIQSSENINPIVNLGVGSVEVAAYSISKKEKHFFSGIGSEEIFAGYERHKNNPTNIECFNGLLKMYERDLLRDSEISSKLKFSFLTPFLDSKLASYSLKIPIKYKINATSNKTILRKAAIEYLGKYSERPKKAAQYGSSFDKAITKLAAKNGFETKKKYYESITE
ncbi:MAG: asparagine synthase C-terminal domain-containing protein [Candidatus Woesearchaeota archaeon]